MDKYKKVFQLFVLSFILITLLSACDGNKNTDKLNWTKGAINESFEKSEPNTYKHEDSGYSYSIVVDSWIGNRFDHWRKCPGRSYKRPRGYTALFSDGRAGGVVRQSRAGRFGC